MFEAFFYHGFPEKTVVHLPVNVLNVGRDLVKHLVVRDARHMISLWVCEVSVSSEKNDNFFQIAALLIKGD